MKQVNIIYTNIFSYILSTSLYYKIYINAVFCIHYVLHVCNILVEFNTIRFSYNVNVFC